MQEFMRARYGVDELSLAAGGSGLAVTLLATAIGWRPLVWIALTLLLLALFRSLSRDLAARRRENEAFLLLAAKIPGLRGRMRGRVGNRSDSGAAAGSSRGLAGVGHSLERARNVAAKMWRNRRTTRYFRCRSCGTILSVPRGKGRIRITCPRCRTVVEKKS